MKTLTTAALAGFALAGGCTTGQQQAAYSLNPALIPVEERLNNGEAILAAERAECVVGRHAAITDFIAAQAAAALALQVVGAIAQQTQEWPSTSPSSNLEQGQ